MLSRFEVYVHALQAAFKASRHTTQIALKTPVVLFGIEKQSIYKASA